MKAFTHTSAGFVGSALCLAFCLTTAAVSGQTTPPGGPTCPTVPGGLTAFSIENAVSLTNLLAAQPPTIPANILASIAGGAQEIRERLVYNAQAKTVTSTIFLVAPGSPLPTPLSSNVVPTTLGAFTVAIDKTYLNCTPEPSIMFVGSVTSSSGGSLIPQGPLGSVVGAPVAISVAYSTDNPPVLSNVVTLVSGVGVAFSPAGGGTVTFQAAPVTPPGSSGTGPTIVLNPNFSTTSVNQVAQNPIAIDASGTAGALTYAWSSVPAVSFAPGTANAAVQQIQFGSPGLYTITLTVTSATGSATTTFQIDFIGRL
jgi:hypothetical protein